MEDIMFMITISLVIVFSLFKKHDIQGRFFSKKSLLTKKLLLICLFLAIGLHGKAQLVFPGNFISDASGNESLNSAAITVLPDGTYLVSHSRLGASIQTSVLHSQDKGESWQLRANLNDITGATLFFYQNDLYLMGTSVNYGDIIIRHSTDFGYSWTAPSNVNNGK